MKRGLEAKRVAIDAIFPQFIRFAGVGAVGTSLHYLILHILMTTACLHPAVSSTVGFVAGATANYLMNYLWTFRSNKPHSQAICRYLVISGIGMACNAAIIAVATDHLHIHYFISQVIATGTILVWNFIGNRVWTFGEASC